MEIDRPLDDLVKKARKSSTQARRGRKPRSGGPKTVGPTRNARGEVVAQARQAKAKKSKAADENADIAAKFPAQTGQGKVVISNLPEDVTESQIKVRLDASLHTGNSSSE
jgi:hypothetical protein